jgi:glycosyltransferase involved in cell wall biosynthesis
VLKKNCIGKNRQIARTLRFMHVFPSFGQGGVPIRISMLINHLGSVCHHTILALDGNISCIARIDPDCSVVTHIPEFNNRNSFDNLFKIRRTLVREQPDILLTHSWGSIEWVFANQFGRSCRHIHFESGFNPEEADRQLLRRELLRRVLLRRADRVVVPSKTLEKLAMTSWRVKPSQIECIPNGVDWRKYSRPPYRDLIPGLVSSPGETIIGTVAPLRTIKNIARLVRAFSAVTQACPARLLIIGEGIERARLAAQVESLGIADRVVFAGHFEQPELVIGLIDVFAISSDSEQMSNSLLQAMASGRPIVATDVGDVADMVAPANRPFVVPKADEAAFYRALLTLAQQPELRDRLGTMNRVRAQNIYPEEKMFAAYRRLLAEFFPDLG